jgi:hypothetical protein
MQLVHAIIALQYTILQYTIMVHGLRLTGCIDIGMIIPQACYIKACVKYIWVFSRIIIVSVDSTCIWLASATIPLIGLMLKRF